MNPFDHACFRLSVSHFALKRCNKRICWSDPNHICTRPRPACSQMCQIETRLQSNVSSLWDRDPPCVCRRCETETRLQQSKVGAKQWTAISFELRHIAIDPFERTSRVRAPESKVNSPVQRPPADGAATQPHRTTSVVLSRRPRSTRRTWSSGILKPLIRFRHRFYTSIARCRMYFSRESKYLCRCPRELRSLDLTTYLVYMRAFWAMTNDACTVASTNVRSMWEASLIIQ